MATEIHLPLEKEAAASLRAGEEVELVGDVFTGRDQACARIHELLVRGEEPPVDLEGQLLYFVGPSPARDGQVVGAVGPTTSGRMNPFIPALMDRGLRGFIGKGYVSSRVKTSLAQHGGVYLGAIGGTGALLSTAIEEVEVVAFAELLSEAVHRMRLNRFPAVVLNDCRGGDLYEAARAGKA